ncbi:hypothetical protein FSARC_8754 [Fusarium sarcochroum]|uniref:Uncharacterized protein n=1 Tax=Fusarium sarcochroum TaxID=1208366 RepID=A0A8H4TSP3_9HYPO|nr:hypothetical protein FSARC_8754 [Fusarium sarcochroum]
MRPPNIHSVVTLAIFLLFSCLLGSATGLPRQQYSGGLKVVRRDDFIEARQPVGDGPTDYYGPPPPYYTGEPVISTDLSSYPTSEESTTGPASQTESSSETAMASQSDLSSQYTTVASGSSSVFVSSVLETTTAMISADSSAKAGSTTSLEAASTVLLTVSDSSFLSESTGSVSSRISSGQFATILSNSSSIPSTHSSPGTDIASDVSSATGMIGTTAFDTDISSVAASSVTVSNTLTETETITESLSRTDVSSTLETSGMVTVTDLTSSNAETESLSGVVAPTSFEDSTTDIVSITTTEMSNVTLTVSPVKSSDSGLTLPSTTYLTPTGGSSHPKTSLGISSDFSSLTLSVSSRENTSATISPAQNSSRSLTEGLTTGTISEEYPTSGSLASGVIRTIKTRSTLTESVSVSESTESVSMTSNVPLTRSASVTATTYLTSTTVTSAAPTDFSESSERLSSTVVASNGSLSDAGTGEFSTTVISKTATVSSIVSTSGAFTTATFTWLTMNSSASVSTFTLSGSLGASETVVSETSTQTSSETLFDSTALPVNATSQEGTASFTVITVSEGSIVTIFPGGVTPTGSATGVTDSSVSTEYSTSTPSRFNSSTTSRGFSSSSQTSSLFDWPTWTLTEPRTSETTLDFPSISMPTSEFSIITTPLIPPNVTTTSTLDSSTLGGISVIRTTWTSTITTSIVPTNLTPSSNVTVAHTSSGYNFSKTLDSEWSTFSSLSTSFASLPGISTTIITRQPTDVPSPFPTNTTISWRSIASSGSLSQSVKSLTSQGPESTWSAVSSGFSSSVPNGDGSTAPYDNSTSTTAVETYPTSSEVSITSTVVVTTYRSLNTTSTAWWLTNTTTVRATVTSTLSQGPAWNSTRTETESILSAETHTLSAISTITSPFPSSLNGTLTSISGSTANQTFTDVSLTIVTPSFSGSFNSSTISLSLTATPPFPLPSNSTATGTGVPLPTGGTGTRPTLISSSREFSTVGATSTPTISTTYYAPNTTLPRTTAGSSTSASSANTPLFPISNSTAFTVTKGTGCSMVNFLYAYHNGVGHYYLAETKVKHLSGIWSWNQHFYYMGKLGDLGEHNFRIHGLYGNRGSLLVNFTIPGAIDYDCEFRIDTIPSGTHTFDVKDTSTYQPLTTLRTITTVRGEESGSAADSYPTPTDRVALSDSLPDDPNFPWGNDFPIHRHQNVSELGIGTGDGGLSTRADWRVQWENVKDRLKGLWHGQALETGG